MSKYLLCTKDGKIEAIEDISNMTIDEVARLIWIQEWLGRDFEYSDVLPDTSTRLTLSSGSGPDHFLTRGKDERVI